MTDRSPTPPKTALFCAVCGHASPPDGDWNESLTGSGADEQLLLTCPDCEATVTRRPAREAPHEVLAAD